MPSSTRSTKIHRNVHVPIHDGEWVVDFLDSSIRVPLTSDRMWLDWDMAVSIIAHDMEVTRTYEYLLQSQDPPTLFFDVGANYGTHSILMGSQGVQVVAFEPNSKCGEYGRRWAAANDLAVRWEHVTVGDAHGTVELVYPERDTWLGAVSAGVTRTVDGGQLITETVDLVSLDDYQDLASRAAS